MYCFDLLVRFAFYLANPLPFNYVQGGFSDEYGTVLNMLECGVEEL